MEKLEKDVHSFPEKFREGTYRKAIRKLEQDASTQSVFTALFTS